MENACVNDKTAAVPLIVKRLGRMAYEAVFSENARVYRVS